LKNSIKTVEMLCFGYENGDMNKFESILFDYGRYIFVSVFRKAQEEERYEDCAVM
jgi:hypothetical protein